MKNITGDIFKSSEIEVIIHGCNCFNFMGGGIAAIISKLFPLAALTDSNTKVGDVTKLGTFNITTCSHPNFEKNIDIVNAYTQFHPGKDLRIEALKSSLTSVAKFYSSETVIGLPRIGCGIAGGNWDEIFPIFQEIFLNHPNTTVFTI